ncbi:hypothetical protein PoB_003630100 [Plakobranchus ocellatus]|uniref:Uncharacterized protein n=1 Tax=Plakobranchus ocellatus TaxID=259542 RepID=A0AAV4ATA4_9GAST|nr:hypothetical protein PoB_003630100 [Plakobranchus ocellatus]
MKPFTSRMITDYSRTCATGNLKLDCAVASLGIKPVPSGMVAKYPNTYATSNPSIHCVDALLGIKPISSSMAANYPNIASRVTSVWTVLLLLWGSNRSHQAWLPSTLTLAPLVTLVWTVQLFHSSVHFLTFCNSRLEQASMIFQFASFAGRKFIMHVTLFCVPGILASSISKLPLLARFPLNNVGFSSSLQCFELHAGVQY